MADRAVAEGTGDNTIPACAELSVGIDLRSLADPHLRGFSRYTSEIVSALAARSGLRLTGFSDVELLHDVPIDVVKYGGRRESMREQWTLPRELTRREIQVFLCPANRGLPFSSRCASVLTLHDATEWDESLVESSRGRSGLRFLYSSAISLAAASLILTVSDASATAISTSLKVPPARIRVAHEAAHDRFSPAPEAEDRQRRLNLGILRPYILYVGGFDRKKDVRTLVAAYAMLASRPDVQLVLAGQHSTDSAVILEQARSLGLGDRIQAPGYVPDESLPALYRGALCFVFPALAEGFGLPVVEAMSCGVPTVVAAAGSLPEVVGVGGCHFPPGDAHALARILENLLCSDRERGQLSAAASLRASDFAWGATGALTEAVLREAAAQGCRIGRRMVRLPFYLMQCRQGRRSSVNSVRLRGAGRP